MAHAEACCRKHTHYTSVNSKNAGSYISDLIAMLGTLFLWIYWCVAEGYSFEFTTTYTLMSLT